MSAVVIAGDVSGTVTLDAPAVAGTTVLTLPARSGTVELAGPAFSAYYLGAGQSLSAGTFTKILINTDSGSANQFDTNNNYDTSNSRFLPTVSGYYQINGAFSLNTSTQILCSLYKNGSQLFTGANIGTASTASVSSLVYLNGSTDYIELYGYPVNAATTISGISTTWLNGALVRAA